MTDPADDLARRLAREPAVADSIRRAHEASDEQTIAHGEFRRTLALGAVEALRLEASHVVIDDAGTRIGPPPEAPSIYDADTYPAEAEAWLAKERRSVQLRFPGHRFADRLLRAARQIGDKGVKGGLAAFILTQGAVVLSGGRIGVAMGGDVYYIETVANVAAIGAAPGIDRSLRGIAERVERRAEVLSAAATEQFDVATADIRELADMITEAFRVSTAAGVIELMDRLDTKVDELESRSTFVEEPEAKWDDLNRALEQPPAVDRTWRAAWERALESTTRAEEATAQVEAEIEFYGVEVTDEFMDRLFEEFEEAEEERIAVVLERTDDAASLEGTAFDRQSEADGLDDTGADAPLEVPAFDPDGDDLAPLDPVEEAKWRDLVSFLQVDDDPPLHLPDDAPDALEVPPSTMPNDSLDDLDHGPGRTDDGPGRPGAGPQGL